MDEAIIETVCSIMYTHIEIEGAKLWAFAAVLYHKVQSGSYSASQLRRHVIVDTLYMTFYGDTHRVT